MIEDRILFVTSFTAEMYSVSGERLVRTFGTTQKSNRLLIATEGMEAVPQTERLLVHDLGTDRCLSSWLARNSDRIPIHLGGETAICGCPNAAKMHTPDHVNGCHWQWMNRNASRWFRKVPSIRAAFGAGFRYVMWLDSDCFFKRDMPLEFFRSCLGAGHFFYFRGERPAPETGIMGFDLARGGRHVLGRLLRQYRTRRYLNYERWDDGYQVGVLLDEGLIQGVDMVRGKGLGTAHVMPHTPMWAFVEHEKGAHARKRLQQGLAPIME